MTSRIEKIKILLGRGDRTQGESPQSQQPVERQNPGELIDTSDPEVGVSADDESGLDPGTEPAENNREVINASNDGQNSEDKSDEDLGKISYFRLFRYSNLKERLFIAIACISSIVHGALLPGFSIVSYRASYSFRAFKVRFVYV